MTHAPGVRSPYVPLGLAVLCVSTGAILVRYADAPALAVSFHRVFLASVLLAPFAQRAARRSWPALNRGQRLALLGSGLALALHFATWIASLSFTSVAVSVLLVHTAPVFAVVRLIASTVDQLDLRMDDGTPLPTWLRLPRRYGSAFDLGDLTQWVVTCMALTGAAYLRCERVAESWRLDALHPGSVQTVVSAAGIVRLDHLLEAQEIRSFGP